MSNKKNDKKQLKKSIKSVKSKKISTASPYQKIKRILLDYHFLFFMLISLILLSITTFLIYQKTNELSNVKVEGTSTETFDKEAIELLEELEKESNEKNLKYSDINGRINPFKD